MEMQAALGIKNSGVDVLPRLQDAIKTSGEKDTKAKAEALSALVDALLAGPDTNVLVDQITPMWKIVGNDEPAMAPAMKYGTDAQIDALVSSLWNLADATKASNPKRARAT